MRLLIYLLAMLTGFSAAEAARPVSAVSPAVDTAIARSYAAVAVNAAEKSQIGPVTSAQSLARPMRALSLPTLFTPVDADTPVLRHDVILG